MKQQFILAIDQGTTGSTALLMDANTGELLKKSNHEFPQIFPSPERVEHNLNDIWESVKKSIADIHKDYPLTKENLISIGITNQRETTCAFDSKGTPLHHAIVWQDRRTQQLCQRFNEDYEAQFKTVTGLPLDPYFSATKMHWLLQNSGEVKRAKKEDDLYFGTIDTYLLYRLTNGTSYKTEPSNASRTLLMNLETGQWDENLLKFFGIDRENLPGIVDSFTEFGKTMNLDFLPDGVPINCILGDQQAALFGQTGVNKGDLKCTYGTGAFLLLNTGSDRIFSNSGLLTTVAYQHEGQRVYALEGSTYIAGAAVQWLRDQLGIIESAPEIEILAKEVKDMKEMEPLFFFPFFTGIGSPYWKAGAKAAMIGITRGTNKKHIARATLEGIALSVNDSIEAMKNDSKLDIKSIKVDGGACANNLLMGAQASFSQVEIHRPKIIETTAYGVALGALVGLKKLKITELGKYWQEDAIMKPRKDPYYPNKSEQWGQMIKRFFL